MPCSVLTQRVILAEEAVILCLFHSPDSGDTTVLDVVSDRPIRLAYTRAVRWAVLIERMLVKAQGTDLACAGQNAWY